jgi:hypothetical protein
MNTIGDNPENNNELPISSSEEESVHPEPLLPEKNIAKVLEQMQILSLKKERGSSGFDLSRFTEPQVDKLLNILDKNEDNAFKYHTKRLDSVQAIQIKKIDASIVDQKTKRFIFFGILAAAAVITLVILWLKQEFFVPWLTFLTGSAGGWGVGRSQAKTKIVKESSSGDSDDENNDDD